MKRVVVIYGVLVWSPEECEGEYIIEDAYFYNTVIEIPFYVPLNIKNTGISLSPLWIESNQRPIKIQKQ